MDILSWIFSGYILLIVHIWFHEIGHYVVGRFLVKIPPKNIKIRFFHYPPHVALRANKKSWIKPNDKSGKYVHTYFTFDPNGKNSFLFIMGGFILQSFTFFLVVLIVYNFLNSTVIANFIIGGALTFNTIYIFSDLILSSWRRSPVGDSSAALRFAPIKTVVFIVSLLLTYVALYFYIGFS